MASAIHPLAFLEQHTSVGAFLSGNKNNHIMAHSKSRNVRHTVSHLTADCVETTEDGRLGDVLLDICNDAVEFIKILSRLTVKVNIPVEIQFLRIIKILYDNGFALRLPYESKDFCMTVLPEDYNLSSATLLPHSLVLLFYTALECKDNRTCGVYNLYVVSPCQVISGRGLPMSTQEHLSIMKFL